MAISKEQIFAVADELDAAGNNPTLAAVRKALGGGSFSTISEGMQEWKARKAAKETPLREPAPPLLAERLSEFGAELWGMALELATGRLAADREALEAARVQLEGERREAAELADQVGAELEEAKGKVIALGEEAQALRDETGRLREQLGALGERAAAAEARAGESERRAGDLLNQLAQVNEQNALLVAALAAAARPADNSAA